MPANHGSIYAMKSVARNFHVPLPDDLHAALRAEAERAGKPATALAREAIETFVHRRRRVALHEAIASYAASCAGTAADLDPLLERAAVEHLLDDEESA
jgi:predicted transcriptional regulator